MFDEYYTYYIETSKFIPFYKTYNRDRIYRKIALTLVFNLFYLNTVKYLFKKRELRKNCHKLSFCVILYFTMKSFGK